MILVTDDPAVWFEWHLNIIVWTITGGIILTGVFGSIWAICKAWKDWKGGE